MKKCFLTEGRPQVRILGRTGLAVSCVGVGVLPMGPGQLDLPLDEGSATRCSAASTSSIRRSIIGPIRISGGRWNAWVF